jgi:signal transduction histidine kinase
MAQLIDDILSLSRLSGGAIVREELDLSALAENVWASLRASDPRRTVDIRIESKIKVRGDPRLLRIALENLLGNAWKFTRKQPNVKIGFGSAADQGPGVYFVRDNGAGFKMEYAEKLFGAFQRLHDAGEFPGTGIGLALVKRIVRRHEGRIWAEAEEGKGAVFYFTLGEDAGKGTLS